LMLLKNKVRTKVQYVMSNEVNKTAQVNYTEEGNIKEKSSFGNKGVVTSTEKYEYDEKGNRTYYERTNANGSYWKRTQYTNNNLIAVENGFDGAEHFTTTYKYNSNGRPTEIIYKINDNIDDKRVYKHEGNTAIVEVYKAGTHLSAKLKLVYDSKNNIVEESTISIADGSIGTRKVFKYNADSKVISEEKFSGTNQIFKLTYAYDADNRLLKQYEEKPGQEKYVEKSFVYDNKGLLTEYQWRRKATEEFNSKKYKYNEKSLCIEIDTYYPATKFSITTGYEYEFY
ncbi:MAG: hypothetical protein MI922_18515, partial [Bacteroidales bacterium]|nr:hypothetical protein [Bacteroidales bacterium]